MKTSDKSPPKIFSQKGQSFLEYALLISFVAAIFLFTYLNGGFEATFGDLFGGSGNSISNISYDDFDSSKSGDSDSSESSGTDTDTNSNANTVSNADTTSNSNNNSNNNASSNSNSNSSSNTDTNSSNNETETAAEVTPATTVTYKPLNWVQEVLPFADGTYRTIVNSDTVDKALSSEIGFFGTLLPYVDDHLASTNAADGTKDWESFLNMVNTTKAKNNFSSSYVRDEQKITVKTVGKDLRITYADKENLYYYKLSPDANNVMQIETNSTKSYNEFFASVISNADGGGWQYSE